MENKNIIYKFIKPFKGTSFRISYDFPLKQTKWYISQILKDFFNMRKDTFITDVKNKSKMDFIKRY